MIGYVTNSLFKACFQSLTNYNTGRLKAALQSCEVEYCMPLFLGFKFNMSLWLNPQIGIYAVVHRSLNLWPLSQKMYLQIFERCFSCKIIERNVSGGSDFCIITSKYP